MARRGRPPSEHDPQATFDCLATLEWVRAHENIHLIGPAETGQSHRLVGTSHATVAAGHQFAHLRLAANSAGKVTDQLLRAELGIGDGLWFAHLDLTSTEALFRLVAAAQGVAQPGRAQPRAIKPGAYLLSEQTTAFSMIDRLPSQAVTAVPGGTAHRMREAKTTEVPGPHTALSYRPFPAHRGPLPAPFALVAPQPAAAYGHVAIAKQRSGEP